MTNFAKQIENGMPVVCTDGTQLGTVDHLEGENSVKLKRNDEGHHHWIPMGWITGVDNGAVTIDRSVSQAQEEWSDSNPGEL